MAIRETITDAIHYWEPRRLLYNLVLALVVVAYFWAGYPASRQSLSLDLVLGVFLLAVIANVCYCAAYLADIFAQFSGFQEVWRTYRWLLFVVGVLFAAVITRFVAMAMFLPGEH